MITALQRTASVFLYMLPWTDAIKYGNEFFAIFPISQFLILPAIPIIIIQKSLPIGNFLVFLILFLGVARNEKVPYFVRYNAMQALLINLILIIFDYLIILLIQISGKSAIIEVLGTIMFITTLTTVIFTTAQCLQGIEPNIPGISNSAKMQI